jgi:putative flippase GtrA
MNALGRELVWTQFLRFTGAGVMGTSGHYLVLVVLVRAFSADAVAASVAGSAVGAAINYLLNYRFTFRSRRPHFEAAPRFFIIAVVSMGLNAMVMWIAVRVVGMYYVWAQVVATGSVLIFNFALNRMWTFGSQSNDG